MIDAFSTIAFTSHGAFAMTAFMVPYSLKIIQIKCKSIHFLIFSIQINFQPVTRLRLHLFLWIKTSSYMISSIDDMVNFGSLSHVWVCALNHFENTIILKTNQRAGTWHKHIQFHSHSILLPLGRICLTNVHKRIWLMTISVNI